MPRMNPPTAGGVAAILIWASCIAVARLLSESLGAFTSGAAIFTIAGLAGCTALALRRGALAATLRLPRRYLWWCGGLFVGCQVGLYGGLGLASSRVQVLEVGAINYLWPALTLLFSLPILGNRARPLPFAAGTILAFSGIVCATMDPAALSPIASLQRILAGPAAYGLALMGAVTWGIYSSLARTWAGHGSADAVPLFLLASGGALWLIRCFVPERSVMNPHTALALAYAALLPAWGAYALWDLGVRRGDFALLSSLSYAIPVLSTLLSCLLLRVRPAPSLWAGIALVTAGAVLCRVSTVEQGPRSP